MRILCTGSNGFIGRHLVNKLVEEGHEVQGADDLSGSDDIDVGIPVWIGDLRDPKWTRDLVDKFKPEVVYHLAANAAENKAQFSPIDISTRNYNTFLNVIVPAINNGIKKVIVASSIAVYGDQQSPFKETDMPIPEDIYGVSKLAVEQTLKILSKVHDFDYVITRPHNVYGPGQNMTDPYRNVVTIFMNALLKGEAYNVYGDGEQRRCFSYIDDVVGALVKTLGVKNLTFNIGSDYDYSVNDLSDVIQNVSKIDKPPIHIEDRPQEVKVATADHKLAKELLSYKDTVTIHEGIKRTWEWCQNKGYQKPVYEDFEIDSPKIPSNWKNG